MTDKNDKTPQADQGVAKKNDPVKKTADKLTSQPVATKKKSQTGPLVLTVVAAAVIVGGGLWYMQQNHQALSEQYESQIQTLVTQSKQNERIANDALTQVRNQSQQVQGLSKRLATVSEQLNDISVAVQTISATDSDLILLNDIEQLITLAQQQLMIGGNLANAIVSLETAQARLAHANRQSLATLMQTINGDLDRLRTVQVADVSTVTVQLNRLKELLNEAPLYVPDIKNSSINGNGESKEHATSPVLDPAKAVGADGSANDAPWWQRTLNQATDLTQKGWETISQDLGDFVSIRRVDDSAALLMSTDQAARFRDNLNLRVTMAQLALLTKQPEVWKLELEHIVSAVEQRFDPSVAMTQRTLALATQLSDLDIDVKLPSLDNSLAAVEALKQAEQSKFGEVDAEVDAETETKTSSTDKEA